MYDAIFRKYKRKFPFALNQHLDREHFQSYQARIEQLLTIEAEDKQVSHSEEISDPPHSRRTRMMVW